MGRLVEDVMVETKDNLKQGIGNAREDPGQIISKFKFFRLPSIWSRLFMLGSTVAKQELSTGHRTLERIFT